MWTNEINIQDSPMRSRRERMPHWSKRHVKNASAVILSAKWSVNRKSITVPVTFPSPAVFPFTGMRCNTDDKKYICRRGAHHKVKAARAAKMLRKFERIYIWLCSIIILSNRIRVEHAKLGKAVFSEHTFKRVRGLNWTILLLPVCRNISLHVMHHITETEFCRV